MKKLVAILLLGACVQALAVEVEGVKLEDRVQVDSATLQLNGAGLRSMFVIKMYVAALYLGEKRSTAEAVLADTGAKRIALHVVAGETATERFLNGFRRGIEKNHSEQEAAALNERMATLERLFDTVKTVKEGDVIAFDWLPGAATRVSVNGRELGRIGGEDFYRALLTIWLGDKPVMDSLKKELLGG